MKYLLKNNVRNLTRENTINMQIILDLNELENTKFGFENESDF